MKTQMMLVVLFLMVNANAIAQSTQEPDIRRRLEMIERGQIEAVRAELPILMTQYQNNPGVLYLQAVLTTDGTEAAKMYQNIVDNFPRSEWADDALYRLYQYYYSIGLYKTAEQKLQQLRQDYPFSAYAVETPPLTDNIADIKQSAAVKESVKQPVKERETAVSEAIRQKYEGTGFTVQIGAFSTLQNAELLKTKFEQEGYTCNIFTMMSNGKKLHKVWVGEYSTYKEAQSAIQEIKQKYGLNAIVVSR